MRCRNCHTVMMDTDPECPTCHASAASATAAAPGPMGNKPNGLLMLLPIFGGALGGLAYAALAGSAEGSASGGRRSGSSSLGSAAWVFGLVIVVVGSLLLGLAAIHFYDTWSVARRQPLAMTAAELRKSASGKTAPDSWIAYAFKESKPTDLKVTRRRLGSGGEAQARCLLVRVEDKWLTASVAPGFEGEKLVGRLRPLDPVTAERLTDKAGKGKPKPAALLPYEFHGVEGSVSDQQTRYMAAAWLGIFGLASLLVGFFLVRGRRHSASSPVMAQSSFLPVAGSCRSA